MLLMSLQTIMKVVARGTPAVASSATAASKDARALVSGGALSFGSNPAAAGHEGSFASPDSLCSRPGAPLAAAATKPARSIGYKPSLHMCLQYQVAVATMRSMNATMLPKACL